MPLQVRVTLLLFAVVTAVNLATPRGAGPDEPSHVVRAAGLARGELYGSETSDPHLHTFDVPGWAGQPDPSCYAFQPDQAASCATVVDVDAPASTAWSYPVLGHVAPAIGTLLPGEARTMWLSRALHTLTCVVLVGAALTQLIRRGRAVSAAAVLLAITPTALFSMAVVNPSGLAIAGAIAMWVFGGELLRAGVDGAATTRHTAWWLAVATAATVLPRDDGLLWVAAIAITLLAVHRAHPVAVARALGPGPSALAAAAIAGAAAWFLFARTDLVPVPVDARGLSLLRLVVDGTGQLVHEAVGNLGWLDTPIPTLAFVAWWAGVALLAGAALERRRVDQAVIPALVLMATLVISWLVEFVQAPDSGLFWQGRYSLPMFVGVVLAADHEPDDAASRRHLALAVGGLAAGCWILSMLQLERRFGVGINGTWAVWDWDTSANPLPPWLLTLVLVAATIALVRTVTRHAADGALRGADQSTK